MARVRTRLAGGAAALLALLAVAEPTLAHGGAVAANRQPVTVPTWLVLLTGGAAVGASFLLATFVTDRAIVRAVDGWRRLVPGPGRLASAVAKAVGVLGLVAVLAVAAVGPTTNNAAVLFVWVGWWAGYTMTTYLVGNSWPALNPWRTLAGLFPSMDEPYPDRLGSWPATLALLALIWVETVSPITDDPRPLAAVVLAYTLVTLAGAAVYGTDTWFRRADPMARVFRYYGAVAPVQRTDDGLSVRLPGGALSELDIADDSEVAFVVALLWATTFDGFVSTAAWADIAGVVRDAGIPLALAYLTVLAGGFGLFLGGYRLSSRLACRTGDTYLSTALVARRFAPSLLAIAAGYHFAHYLGFLISLAPAIVVLAATPLSTPLQVPVLPLPGWFDLVGMAAILLGHVLAIWVAHATAYDLFPGRLQAVRSQYPFIAVMVVYTMTSLWLLAQPEVLTP
ncbi:MAG: hypothetical protein V5A30_00690 [Haloarculaceae archaeon]